MELCSPVLIIRILTPNQTIKLSFSMCFQAFQNKFFSALWASFGLQIGGEEPSPGSSTEKKTFACLENCKTKHYIPAVKIIVLFLRFCHWLLSIFHWFWKFMNMSAGDLCLILFITPNKQFYGFFLKAFFLFFLTQGT